MLGQVEDAEAALLVEMELAASADRILSRRNFARQLCGGYQARRTTFDTLEDIADGALTSIQTLYPAWMAEPLTAMSVAVLCAFTLSKKGLDSYCSS